MRHATFSIVIPTYNRFESLKRLLISLTKVKYAGQFDIHIIENGPEQSARALLPQFQKLLSIHYHYTAIRGTAHARNIGITASDKQYILCLDDDVVVQPGILTAYDEAWKRYPGYTILGGGIHARKEDGTEWSEQEKKVLAKYGWCAAHQPSPEVDTILQLSELLFSANMSFKRTKEMRFNERLGRPFYGETWVMAEDYELCYSTM